MNAGTLKLNSTNTSSSFAIASGAVLEIGVAPATTTLTGGTYTGSGVLRKTGPGRIRWSGATDFALDASATIDVQEGTLQASTLANQPWANNQASLNVAAGALFDVDAAAVRVGGLTGSGTVTLGLAPEGTYPDQKLTVGVADATSEFAGVIQNGTGTAPFEKVGAGTLTLTGSNTFTGGLTVSGGSLVTNAAGRLAATLAPSVASGATLSLGGDQTLAVVTGAGTLDLSAGTLSMGGTTGEFAGTLSGAGNLAKTGAGTLTLSGTASSFTGNTTLSAGTLVLNNANALGTASVLSMAAGTTLTLNQRTYVGDFDQLGGTINGTGELVSTLFRTESGTLAAVIAGDDGGVARGIRKIGSGTTTITAANTFTGTVRVEAGTLALGSGGSFAAGASAVLEGGTLDLAGTATTFTALDGTGGTIDLGAGALTVSGAGSFGGVISGTGSVTKDGSGDLVLSGANTFAGGTTVSAGRLSINGSLASPAVTVSGGTLGGSGSIAGGVSIGSGASFAPGNSIESISAGATTFASGATFAYEVDSTDLGSLGTAADLLVVDGNLSIASGSLLSFADIGSQPGQFVQDTTVFAMINYTGTWDGGTFTYNSQPLTDGSRFFAGGQMWEIDYDYAYNTASPTTTQPLNYTGDFLPVSGTQTFVTVTAVPEPSTYVMLAIAAGIGAIAARRRRTAA